MFTPSLRPAALALILAMGTAACNMADSDVAPIAMIKTDAQSIADGRTIAEAQCSNCHALDQDAKIRPEDFQAGLHVGHNMMPDFVFGPLGAEVLLAYMVSIQQEPPAGD